MRIQMLAVLPFALGLAIWHTVEFVHLCGAWHAPVVEGTVIDRKPIRRFGGIPAGQLSIRIAGTDTVVVARTNKHAMKELPDQVQFRYTGDPNREVFIQGEEHPLWVALFLWVVSAGIVVFCLLPFFRPRRRRWNAHLLPVQGNAGAGLLFPPVEKCP
jgi:hypothetical protein